MMPRWNLGSLGNREPVRLLPSILYNGKKVEPSPMDVALLFHVNNESQV